MEHDDDDAGLVDTAGVTVAKIDPHTLRTRAQITAEDLAPGTILCRGPRRLTADQFATGMAKRARLRAAVDPAGLRAMADALTRFFDGVTVDDPSPPDLTVELRRTAALLDRRVPCGEDLGVLRAASGEAFDGQRHTQVCPRCGEPRAWWPAVSVEDFPALQADRAAALTTALT